MCELCPRQSQEGSLGSGGVCQGHAGRLHERPGREAVRKDTHDRPGFKVNCSAAMLFRVVFSPTWECVLKCITYALFLRVIKEVPS